MTTIGVIGQQPRVEVDQFGDLAGAGWRARFAVAADDRWYVVHREVTVRQHLVQHTPVVETRVRVSGGDVVFTTYSAADLGGVVVVEIDNDTPLPVVVATDDLGFFGAHSTAVDVPPEPLSAPMRGVPIGHRSTVRIARPLGAAVIDARRLAALPSAEIVVAGWRRQCSVGSTVEVPDDDDLMVRVRTELLLTGPTGTPGDVIFGIAELIQMGHDPEPWVLPVAQAVTTLVRERSALASLATRAAVTVLAVADERRAVADLRRGTAESPASILEALRDEELSDVARLAARRLAMIDDLDELTVFAHYDPAWVGRSTAVHHAVTAAGPVSAAVRWHGDRPALLWERHQPGRLRCGLDPAWSSDELVGEALLAPVQLDAPRLER
jgi:hypothetical protein